MLFLPMPKPSPRLPGQTNQSLCERQSTVFHLPTIFCKFVLFDCGCKKLHHCRDKVVHIVPTTQCPCVYRCLLRPHHCHRLHVQLSPQNTVELRSERKAGPAQLYYEETMLHGTCRQLGLVANLSPLYQDIMLDSYLENALQDKL